MKKKGRIIRAHTFEDGGTEDQIKAVSTAFPQVGLLANAENTPLFGNISPEVASAAAAGMTALSPIIT